MSFYEPASAGEICSIVREARDASRTLRISGGGTREGLGRPVDADAIVSLRGLSGILIYEPAEMVLRASAGTPLETIDAALAANNQMLPFEPMDHRGIYGSQGSPTIGALVCGNISGPRRVRAGAARDALIGVRFVNGAAEEIASGGRVMKNVTGLDLVKLQSGAFGTLGVLTEVTFKLLPRPEYSGTLILEGLNHDDAIRAMTIALQSPFEVSGAARVENASGSQTAIRVEHFPPSVEYRIGQLRERLAEFAPGPVLDDTASQHFWRAVRDVASLTEPYDNPLWRISIKSSAAAEFVRKVRTQQPTARVLLDHGGGLVWLSIPASEDAGSQLVRGSLPAGAGHAMLVRARDEIRRAVPVFQPQPEGVMKLSAAVKHSLDPGGIFNPGRMYAGL